jgi:hypothetical protein
MVTDAPLAGGLQNLYSVRDVILVEMKDLGYISKRDPNL